jgi:hypothetical protein
LRETHETVSTRIPDRSISNATDCDLPDLLLCFGVG